jgi:hypothetical protein
METHQESVEGHPRIEASLGLERGARELRGSSTRRLTPPAHLRSPVLTLHSPSTHPRSGVGAGNIGVAWVSEKRARRSFLFPGPRGLNP